jgi:hypothetical protein
VGGGLEGKELNYEEMDDEHRRLLAVIRDATSETKVQPTDKVVLRCQVRSVPPSRRFNPNGHRMHWAARDICAGTQLVQTRTNRAHPHRDRRATSNPS